MASFPALPLLKPHGLAVPIRAQGHINPLMRFCKILASRGFMITFVNVGAVHHRIAASSHEPTTYQEMPSQAEDENLLRKVHVPLHELDMGNYYKQSLEHFFAKLEGLSDGLEQLLERFAAQGQPATFIISDVLVSSVTQKLADKFNIPRVSFFTHSVSFSLFWFYMLNGQISMRKALNVLKGDRSAESFQDAIPGLPALRNKDLPTFKHIFDETEYMYLCLVRHHRISQEKAQAIVFNSFDQLERPSLEALRKQLRQPIYPVGPLTEELTGGSSTSLWKEDNECLQWLDEQPFRSVLYISFGSTTLLSKTQFEEFLAGVKASKQRFLWVYRPDLVGGVADGSCIPGDSLAGMKDQGYVVTWAPQLRVLSHPAVGGFLTHCGWNSTMEAIASGVPMLCWPYFSDQFMVANCVVEKWKIGLRFEEGEGGVVGRGEVRRAVKVLMEEETLRANVAELKDAGRRSLKAGGTTYNSIDAFVQLVTNTCNPS